MIKEYKLEGKRNSSRSKLKVPLLLYTIIPFLAFFLYILVFSQTSLSTLKGTILGVSSTVVYDSYTISFDDTVSKDIRDMVVSKVDDIEFNGVKRFIFVEDTNSDFNIKSTTSDDYVISSYRLIPVGHLYWVKSKISTDSLKDFDEILMEESEYSLLKEYFNSLPIGDVDIKKCVFS
jgi:hypothetical protein